jgi:hypothetical protein
MSTLKEFLLKKVLKVSQENLRKVTEAVKEKVKGKKKKNSV